MTPMSCVMRMIAISVPLLEVIEKVQHVRLDGHVQWSRVVDIDATEQLRQELRELALREGTR
jgi:hypothetical protein